MDLENTFLEFVIISDKDLQAADDTREHILLNINHIVSIKPIRIVSENEVMQGLWIRMSNGKKYKAVDVPESVKSLLPKKVLELEEDD